IEQKSASSNPRSTVGTITELTDYMRVLWARAGVQHCTVCRKPVKGRSAEEIAEDVLTLSRGTKVLLLAPLVTHRKGEFRDVFGDLVARGFVRVRVNGEVHRLDAPPTLDKKRKHTVELVLDRITVEPASRTRIVESVELGLAEGKG